MQQYRISGREEAGITASHPSKVQNTVHIESKGSQVPICLLQKYFSCRVDENTLVKLSNELIRLVVKPIEMNRLVINSQLTSKSKPTLSQKR